MARPTLLNDQLKERARDYIAMFRGVSFEDLKQQLEVIPSIAGLAAFLGVSRDSLYNWSKIDAEFFDILERVKSLQEIILLNAALVGAFNPAMAKLLLYKHGYSDKQEIDHRSGDKSMTPNKIELVVIDSKDYNDIKDELSESV